MNKLVKEIINNDHITNKEKMAKLKELESDILLGKDIISGKYKYCEKCDDYYLAKSFLTDKSIKNGRICTYVDPINSGGNDYEDGIIETIYSICPKGHKKEIDRKEYKK